jgi:hypothetical protein
MLERNRRELESFLNSSTVRFNNDGSLSLPAGTTVGGSGVSLDTHDHDADYEPIGAVAAGTYTPVLTATGSNPTLSESVGWWSRAGEAVTVWGRVVFSSAGTGTYQVSLPFSPDVDFATVPTGGFALGSAYLFDQSATVNTALMVPRIGDGTNVVFRLHEESSREWTHSVPITIVSSDHMSFMLTYLRA